MSVKANHDKTTTSEEPAIHEGTEKDAGCVHLLGSLGTSTNRTEPDGPVSILPVKNGN